MASRREIRRRIKSIKNTAQITKAMQMVAASRMRRAQARVTASRPYADHLREIVADISGREGAESHPLLHQREVRTAEIVMMSPNRGLAGGLVSNLRRETIRLTQRLNEPYRVVAIGRIGRDFAVRSRMNLVAEFTAIVDNAAIVDFVPIVQQVLDDFESGFAD